MTSKRGLTRTQSVAVIIIVVIVAVGIAAYIFLQPPPPRPPGPATITGKVTDAKTGAPIVGATVTLDGLKYITGPDGTYSFSIKVGKYTLTVSMTGYETKTASVDAKEEKTYTINVALPLIPPPPPPPNETIKGIEYVIDGFLDKTGFPLNFTTPTIVKVLMSSREIEEEIKKWIPQILLSDPRSNATYLKFYTIGELKEYLPRETDEFINNVTSFLKKIVRPGDIVYIVIWSYLLEKPYEKPFESPGIFIVDNETRKPKFDTVIFFVPIISKIEVITNSSISSNVSIRVNHYNHHYNYNIYHEKMNVTGYFEVIPLDSNKSKFTLDLYFIEAKRGGMTGFFVNIFSDVMVTMGSPEKNEIKLNEDIGDKRPLYSYFLINGSGKFPLDQEPLMTTRGGDKSAIFLSQYREKNFTIVNTGFCVKSGSFKLEGIILRDEIGPGKLSFKTTFILIDVPKGSPEKWYVLAKEEKVESRKICD